MTLKIPQSHESSRSYDDEGSSSGRNSIKALPGQGFKFSFLAGAEAALSKGDQGPQNCRGILFILKPEDIEVMDQYLHELKPALEYIEDAIW